MNQPRLLQLRLLHPRYWLTWLGLGLVTLIVHLPPRAWVFCGAAVGGLGYLLARSRRHIVDVNLSLCFPDLDAQEHRELGRRVFRSSGIALIETAAVWLRPPSSFRSRVDIVGLENVTDALAEGQGVILLGMHLATLDFCGAVVATEQPFHVMYRKNKNELLEALMTGGRQRNFPAAIERDDIRTVIRAVRSGNAVWYGPDQDYGPQHSVYAPFFGQSAATITATARLARITGAPVILYTHYRQASDETRYVASFSRPIQGYPTDDAVADAATINALIEDAIRRAPDQYWWLHRRFKTRPEGKQARPY